MGGPLIFATETDKTRLNRQQNEEGTAERKEMVMYPVVDGGNVADFRHGF